MIDRFFTDSTCLQRLRCGPLGPHLDGYAQILWQQGYARASGAERVRTIAQLSRWLGQKKLPVNNLNEERIAEFVQSKPKRRWRRGNKATLEKFLQYLRQGGIIARPVVCAKASPLDCIERDYGQFLIQERGLTQATLDNYLPVARRFLSGQFGTGKVCLDKLETQDVTGFILGETASRAPSGAQLTTKALRSFFGFLYRRGELATNLAAAVPTVAGWRLAGLPEFLEPAQVQKLLRTCHRNSPVGRRDYAVLLLMARLGLRAGEVVHLNLENINWEAGEVLIHGKSSREDRLPLLPDVGQALVQYLQKDRPCCACRRVFLRMKAPRQGFSGSSAICDIFRRALVRAQLHPQHQGAHLLRRSLATQMLGRGASLTQIGQVLRHQRTQTTEIYAKVDLAALRALAQPWPGGVP